MNPLIFLAMGLFSTTTVLLEGWIWHYITQLDWYAIKQQNKQTNLPLNSNSHNFFSRSVGTVPRTLMTIGIIIIFIYSFFNPLARFTYLSTFSLSFIFTLRSNVTTKSFKWQILFFLVVYISEMKLVDFYH